ncbi:MAG TPA: glycosyl transferase family 1 [Rhodospirillaceae bacterium]|nr:glycosyl transferase family 1 [Candidatus Neomarinimicrobiota bacterium]HCX15210.1 glycosyl transferase family 1 [Rhodospirillaceae bacterium]
MNNLPLPLRFALRELRGGMRDFRIFLACIAIGVAAIAGATSLNESVKAGIESDARPLLGGDLQIDADSYPIDDKQRAGLEIGGTVSGQVQLRSMARTKTTEGKVESRTLIELKAVESNYPLYGSLELTPTIPLQHALAQKDGIWGAAIDDSLRERLNIDIGDMIYVGEAALQVRAVVVIEPDRAVSFATVGPRVMISREALPSTDLVQMGSLVEFKYNIRLDKSESDEDFRTRLDRDFPTATWRIRGLTQAAGGLERFIDNVTLFLTLVGLTALLTGGIGVANAVRAHLLGRFNTIATLKCLGAPADMIFYIYLIQLGILAFVGILIGLILGATIPFIAANTLGDLLPVKAGFGLYPYALIKATIFGALTAALFTLWPLARARDIPPVALFRSLLADQGLWPRKKYVIIIVIIAAALGIFTVSTAEEPRYALYFVGGAALSMILFRIAATGVMRFAARMAAGRNSPTAGSPTLRLAFANLYRPGSPTTSVVLSLGLGLSVLVAIALVESNLNATIEEGLPSDAPSMFFIDIQPQQEERFRQIVESIPGVEKVLTSAMIRGRVVRINDVPAAQIKVAPGSRWAIRGERSVSHAAKMPENTRLTQGKWWPADHTGENFVSIDAEVAQDIGVSVGDTITINILGRDITAQIASLRDIRWQSGAMNFTYIFSPNALIGAPSTYLATLKSKPETELTIENAVLNDMPNVTVVQVRQALDTARGMLNTLGLAVRMTAAVALISGAVVLAGAVAAGHARRIYESVVLKVLGATRADVLKAFIFEYLLLGVATGLIAAIVGALGAWSVVTEIMRIVTWRLDYGLVIIVLISCIAVTLLAGFMGTWRAMGVKSAPHLRNE